MKKILKTLNLYRPSKVLLQHSYDVKYFKRGAFAIFSAAFLVWWGTKKYLDNHRKLVDEKISESSNKSPYILNQFLAYNMNGKINNELTKITDRLDNLKYVFENKLFLAKGEFDFTKELLVSHKFENKDGYYVFTPFYVYEDDNDFSYYDDPNHKHQDNKKSIPIIINRGW